MHNSDQFKQQWAYPQNNRTLHKELTNPISHSPKKHTTHHKITINKRGELIQERIDRIPVHISRKCKPTNHTNKQNTGQEGALNRSVALQSGTISLRRTLIPFLAVVVALGAKEPLEALGGAGGGLLKSGLLGLLERRTGLEEVESVVGSEAEEEGGGERGREVETWRWGWRWRPERAHYREEEGSAHQWSWSWGIRGKRGDSSATFFWDFCDFWDFAPCSCCSSIFLLSLFVNYLDGKMEKILGLFDVGQSWTYEWMNFLEGEENL